MKRKIYIYCQDYKSHGLDVIKDNLIESLKKHDVECVNITSLNNVPKDAEVIPHTLDQSYITIENGFNSETCLLMDALTLGYWNKIMFFLKQGSFLKYSFWYCIAAFCCNIIKEIRVVRGYKKIMLVSQTDINYLKRFAKKNTQFFCVPNGINLPLIKNKNKSKVLRLGILSSWNTKTSAQENDWFIKDYFRRYQKKGRNVELVLAGRGPYINDYENIENVKVMGEVNDLNDFFCNIDVFIAAIPKGCGILNRVLDSFAYKTIVLGHEKAFSGFTYMHSSYFSFSNYKSFETNLNFIVNNPDVIDTYIENAYSSIKENNNWEKNYSAFINQAIL